MDLKTLPALTVLSDNVTIVEQNGIKIVRVNHDKASAGISLHGGHVIWFQPKDQQDLIWMSEKAEFDTNKALRGGIPVCWPWFGKAANPSHGFVRTSEWQLIEHRESEQGVIIVLGIEDSEATQALWPHKFSARLYIDIQETLKVTLDAENTDTQAWQCSGALHTYLTVGDINQVEVTGMGPLYLDGLQQGKACESDVQTLTIGAMLDRVYTKADSQLSMTDKALNRQVMVKNGGQNAAVIWNPWVEGAQSMADMADNGYQTMLCIESTYHATNLENGYNVAPGEHFILTTEISTKAN
ncbi:Putative glucose-6-phosphate 1-epimerase [Vibrio stylophorae]|uniref:Putative glucose-6-phosphate 1-epimerase n=1 Tax=Vibrio stylophorae TaxID=659351 RepID=A0ABM8ZU66_9VIBR|nr:D-hexose-6-phosphate mutarotase [Vibrio stylophorae]CAH0533857.1 Putative glucose-6-phosphate 1-epimerase [Vibrio stylophorae]